jgi:simple sugar transport system substrate-binding protein
MLNLSEVIEGWGKSDAFLEPWMEQMAGCYVK